MIATLASGLARKSSLELLGIAITILLALYLPTAGFIVAIETNESLARQAAKAAADQAIRPTTPAQVATVTPQE